MHHLRKARQAAKQELCHDVLLWVSTCVGLAKLERPARPPGEGGALGRVCAPGRARREGGREEEKG